MCAHAYILQVYDCIFICMITLKEKKEKIGGVRGSPPDANKHGYMLLACIHAHTLSIHANTNSNHANLVSACHGYICIHTTSG